MSNIELNGRMNGSPRLRGRVLVLACAAPATTAAPASTPARWATRWLPRLRAHTVAHSIHYANPRSAAYQLALVEAVVAAAPASTIEVRLDRSLVANLADTSFTVELIEPTSLTRNGTWDTIVLVYADALGLGHHRIERAARACCANVVIVNGRRRWFTLDDAAARALAWRRLLAGSRVVELAAAAMVLPIAGALALVDRVRGHE